MQSDLFRALLDSRNSRDHPILDALLYEFCPAAAHWWLAGVDPILPYDMVWKMMEMRATGINLRQALESFNLGGLVNDMNAYMNEIISFRSIKGFERIASPELLPQFNSEVKKKAHDFGYSDGYTKLGGQRGWTDVLEFVRLWSFVFVDWQINAHAVYKSNETNIEFKLVSLALMASGMRQPAYFPGWLWKVKTRLITRNIIGLPVNNIHEQDQLKFTLVLLSTIDEEKQSWGTPPDVYAMDRKTGEVNPCDLTIRDKDAIAMIKPLATMAKKGPYPPLNALTHPQTCPNCGFVDQCYRKGVLSEFAMNSLEIGL